jgi:hypothetical protein
VDKNRHLIPFPTNLCRRGSERKALFAEWLNYPKNRPKLYMEKKIFKADSHSGTALKFKE